MRNGNAAGGRVHTGVGGFRGPLPSVYRLVTGVPNPLAYGETTLHRLCPKLRRFSPLPPLVMQAIQELRSRVLWSEMVCGEL
jgi:hypothetical protein